MKASATACLVFATVGVAACGGGAPQPGQRSAAPGITTYRDAARRFSVSFPSTWRRSPRSLTPTLADPKEILAVGTARFVVDPRGCAHMPVGALEALGPDDVLITLLERRGLHERGSPARPRRFTLGAEAAEALLERHWPSLRHAAYLVVGDNAAAGDIAQEAFLAALASLTSLTGDVRLRRGCTESRATAPSITLALVPPAASWQSCRPRRRSRL